jgi:lipoprotein-releasing system permease protein
MKWTNSIALRFFKSAKHNSFTNLARKIAVSSIAFSTCILIVTLSVVRGFHQDMIHKILKESGHVMISSSEKNFDPSGIKEFIRGHNYEEVVQSVGLLIDKKITHVILKNSPNDKTIIGTGLANSGYKVGSKINAIIPMQAPSPLNIVPENFELTVDAISEFDSYESNNYTIFVNKTTLQKKLSMENKVHKIIIYLKDPNTADETRDVLRKKIPGKFYVFSWKDQNRTFLKILNMEKNMICLVLLAIILLSILLVIFSTILLINVKIKEISILKILGAKKKDIMAIFIKINFLTSLLGSIYGVILGIGLTNNLDKLRIYVERLLQVQFFDPELYLTPHLPVLLEYSDIVWIVSANLIFTLASSILTSRKAAKINALTNLQ